jgi:hypothetical protein
LNWCARWFENFFVFEAVLASGARKWMIGLVGRLRSGRSTKHMARVDLSQMLPMAFVSNIYSPARSVAFFGNVSFLSDPVDVGLESNLILISLKMQQLCRLSAPSSDFDIYI